MEQFNDFICFRLATLSRRITRYYNSRFADLGITIGQSFVLFSLLAHDGSSVKELASALQLDSPAVTGLVDRLVKEGLVERREDPEDRRSIRVLLTPAGHQAAEEALRIAQGFNLHLGQAQTPAAISEWERALEELESQLPDPKGK